MEIAATSTEFVKVTATSTAGGSSLNPAAPPKFAFLPTSATGNPVTEDWLTGSGTCRMPGFSSARQVEW